MWDLYKVQPAFVLGFHGCDADVAASVIAGTEHLNHSNKKHDWLGGGAYFWEGSPHRALEWAEDMAQRPSTSPNRIRNPAVVGAIIDLRNCCNLFDSSALDELKDAWQLFRLTSMRDGASIPVNKGATPDRLGTSGTARLSSSCTHFARSQGFIRMTRSGRRSPKEASCTRVLASPGEATFKLQCATVPASRGISSRSRRLLARRPLPVPSGCAWC